MTLNEIAKEIDALPRSGGRDWARILYARCLDLEDAWNTRTASREQSDRNVVAVVNRIASDLEGDALTARTPELARAYRMAAERVRGLIA